MDWPFVNAPALLSCQSASRLEHSGMQPTALRACAAFVALGVSLASCAAAPRVAVPPAHANLPHEVIAVVTPPPPPVPPPAAPAASAEDPRAWLKRVPDAPVEAQVGDLVWAAVPSSNAVRFEPFRVIAVAAGFASVEDGDKNVFAHVSGALVHPAHPKFQPTIGDLVTYYDWRRDVGLALVQKDRLWMAHLSLRFRDSQKVVREESINIIEPRPEGVAPFQWVFFPMRGAQHKGLVFATTAEEAFVLDAEHLAHVVPRRDVKALPVSARAYKVGDAVIAYAYDVGYRAGSIERVFVPGYSYAVKLEGEADTRDLYFTDFVDHW